MARLGSLDEWTHFLDAKSDDESAAALARHCARLDATYEELCSSILPLWDSPTGEVVEALMVARSAMAEAIGMLMSVRSRFDSGERETA
jgi:hypothetical protein